MICSFVSVEVGTKALFCEERGKGVCVTARCGCYMVVER